MTLRLSKYIILFVYTNMLVLPPVFSGRVLDVVMLEEDAMGIIAMGESACDFSMDDVLVKEEDIDRASRSLKAISHPLRLKILCVLGDKEVSVQDIVDNVGTSQSNISQHLAILRDKGILASRKDANRVYYRVGDYRTLRLISMMQEVFCSVPH
jgi:ArsR family transcriptional regulator